MIRTLQAPEDTQAIPGLWQNQTIPGLRIIQTTLAPGAIHTPQTPEEVQTIPRLWQSQMPLGAIRTIHTHSKSQTTLNLHEILTLQVPEAVKTMRAPEQILIILTSWENQTILELREMLPILAPEPIPTIQALEGIKDMPVPGSNHP